MQCCSREGLFLSLLWLDTSVEDESRGARMWVNEITIKERIDWTEKCHLSVIVMMGPEERRDSSRSCFLWMGTQSTALKWQRERMKNGMAEMLLFVHYDITQRYMYEGMDGHTEKVSSRGFSGALALVLGIHRELRGHRNSVITLPLRRPVRAIS